MHENRDFRGVTIHLVSNPIFYRKVSIMRYIHLFRDWFVNRYPVQVMTIYLWWYRFQVWFVVFYIVALLVIEMETIPLSPI